MRRIGAYDDEFYKRNISGMRRSADIILRLLFDVHSPKTVIDVGCGQGAWLAAAEALGATTLKGMDGAWVKNEDLISKNIDFVSVDLDTLVINQTKKYDLCISVEVAEHISDSNAQNFVGFLCDASDVVLFSAAIKYQGGKNHVNEQWQSYWANIFKTNGYECLDILRGAIWDDKSVEWWYRQNIFVFAKKDSLCVNVDFLRLRERPILDVVHPENYQGKINSWRTQVQHPSLRFCVACIIRYFGSHVRQLIGSRKKKNRKRPPLARNEK